MLAPTDIPVIPRGVRVHRDAVRSRWVLLAPERTIALDEIGHAILTEIDNETGFDALVGQLAAKYNAPAEQIAGDVSDFIEKLAERRFMEITR